MLGVYNIQIKHSPLNFVNEFGTFMFEVLRCNHTHAHTQTHTHTHAHTHTRLYTLTHEVLGRTHTHTHTHTQVLAPGRLGERSETASASDFNDGASSASYQPSMDAGVCVCEGVSVS